MTLLPLVLLLWTLPWPPTPTVSIPANTRPQVGVRMLTQQSGMPTSVAPGTSDSQLPQALGPAPYWQVVEQLARLTNCRVEVAPRGGAIRIAPGNPAPSSTAGPFRMSIMSITSRLDFDTGLTVTDLALAIHWEMRTPVLRLDAEPTVTRVTDEDGERAIPPQSRARVPAQDYEHLTTSSLPGLPRTATRIVELSGRFRVTAAPRTLIVKVPTLGTPITRDGVTITVGLPVRRGTRVEVVLDLTMPESGVRFESFEAGIQFARTRFELVSPTGARFTPENSDDEESGNRIRIVYRFPENLPVGPDWAAVVTTPAPLQEYNVPFSLREILLP